MTEPITLETDRLILRPWRTEDLAPFAALNADPDVMEFFPAPLSRQHSDRLARDLMGRIEKQGHGWFALEVKGGPDFIGFVGLNEPDYGADLPCGPCTEIGWRLAKIGWGKGYASEAARACLALAFDDLGLEEVVSFTAIQNVRSQAVMQRLGMVRDDSSDFDHPRLAPDHWLARHVLYRMPRALWATLKSR